MRNDIAWKTTDDTDGGYVKCKKVFLCHYSTMPYESSLGFNQRNTGGITAKAPA